VVASSGGALPEVVGPDGEAALLVPPGDPGALAQALGRVLSCPSPLGERLGHAGRRRVLARYTWARCAAGAVEQYRSVLAPSAPARPSGGGARTEHRGPTAGRRSFSVGGDGLSPC
jgi:glycosyltransferase involved in cell wall biosynthesis